MSLSIILWKLLTKAVAFLFLLLGPFFRTFFPPLFLLLFIIRWPGILTKTYKKLLSSHQIFSFKAKNMAKPRPQQLRLQFYLNLSLINNFSKSDFPSYILELYIRIAKTFVNSIRITLRQLELQNSNRFYLPYYFHLEK